MKSLISDITFDNLCQLNDDRGSVLHMIRAGNCDQIKEVYLSEVLPGAIKAWKRHKVQTQRFAVPWGRVRLAVYDTRPASLTNGKFQVVDLGRPDKYCLIKIPPMLWYGFQGLESTGLIVNCTDLAHDPDECERVDYRDERFPFVWGL